MTTLHLEHKFATGGSIEQTYTLSEGYLVDYAFRLVDLQENIAENTIRIL